MTSARPLISLIDEISLEATTLQDKASNPTNNVWVGASAGTGKTKVLTDRVLRLLLPRDGYADGIHPDKILCITFTKAGAAEMVARVTKILSQWAVCDRHDLETELETLLGHPASLNQIDRARQLFASVIDLPGGLKITTIHAFCQSVLGRFPLEAGLSPQFELIEESESRALIQQARNNLITDIRDNHNRTELHNAFENLSTWKNGEQINKLIQSAINQQARLVGLRHRHGSVDGIYRTLCAFLNISPDLTREGILRLFFTDPHYPSGAISTLADALAHGATKNQEKAAYLSYFISLPLEEKIKNYETYRDQFLTQKGGYFADSHVTNGAKAYNPDAPHIFTNEATRLFNCHDRLQSVALAQSTLAYLTVAYDMIDRYTALKTRRNVLDYNDLILRTRDLLYGHTPSGRMMTDWVLYKIDGGIDHILVDEAQDTNPAQWDIILKIIEEFFDGESARNDADTHRSVFIVGDEKQSIFRFQGAQPDIFDEVKNTIEQRITHGNQPWEQVPMGTSFRSVPAILDIVDAIFQNENNRRSVVQDPATTVQHTAYRQGQSGRVELWPPYKSPPPRTRSPWELPVTIKQPYNARAALASRIALQINEWITNRDILPAKGRAIQPGDIMILVKSRNNFVDYVIRALKSFGIPVSGIDRMVITNQIVVQDILAVLSFAMLPSDDLTLATILKSPFIGLDDSDIEPIAHHRSGSLWAAVKESAPRHIVDYLSGLIADIPSLDIFGAINRLLVTPTPDSGKTGWQAIIGRLGHDAVDPVEELLSMARIFDTKNPETGVQGFLHHMQSDKRELKREMESGGDMVRIMTVHASKGLQSPIVILPDAAAMPKSGGNSDDGFLWSDTGLPLWIRNADDGNESYNKIKADLRAKDMDEYQRLLYVALTRAEDRLIVCATQKNKELPDNCWYATIKNSMSGMGSPYITRASWTFDSDYMTDTDPVMVVYETPQSAQPPEVDESKPFDKTARSLPQWALQPAPVPQYPSKTLMPSRMEDDDVPVRSPLVANNDAYRFRRGLLTHALLQYLPDVKTENRAAAADTYLQRQAPDIPAPVRQSIRNESLAILTNPDFSMFFGENSMAEVPVTGTVIHEKTGKKDIISGQIDRMLVTDKDIWIIDYKSNRPPPRDIADVPAQYKNQLAAYKQLMGQIYPKHIIHCALLWTDGPFMMKIDGM